jgi:3-epi-6-deoxocathasterone 23-monooxygenase
VCRYGNVFKTNILGTGVIVSTDPEVNKVILQNQSNIFVPAYPKSIRELMGEHSILQMNGNMHRKIHSLLGGFMRSPQFKARITRDIEHSIKQCLATWTHQPIYVQDQVKKVICTPLSLNIIIHSIKNLSINISRIQIIILLLIFFF